MAADAWLCWRVLDGPILRAGTVAAAPAAPAAAPFRVRLRAPRKQSKPRRAALIAALAGALAAVGLTDGGRYARPAPPLVQEVDRLAELAGFGLHQVSITGHRFTPDAAIFDAFDFANMRSLLRFDGAAVRERIERLAWVEAASVTRMLPDQVRVHIVERTPFAVWQRAGGDLLIDATGRVLGAAGGAQPNLPRIAGEAARAEAAEMLALVSKYPELSRRIDVAERVGARRWTLRLTGGPDILLPAAGAPEALARLMAAHGQGRLLEAPYAVIDTRADDRIAVRPRLSKEASDGRGGPAEPRGGWPVP